MATLSTGAVHTQVSAYQQGEGISLAVVSATAG